MSDESSANRIELTQGEIEALLPAHALGTLEPGEAGMVERYLRNHERLLVQSASLTQITAHLGYAAEPVAPSISLRQQILSKAAATALPQPDMAPQPAANQPDMPPLAEQIAAARPAAPTPRLLDVQVPQPRFDFFRRLYAWRTAAIVSSVVMVIVAAVAFTLLDRTTGLALLEEEMASTIAALQTEVSDLSTENAQLVQTNRDQDETNSALAGEIADLQVRNDSLMQNVERLRAEIEAGQQQLASLSNVERAVALGSTSDDVTATGTLLVNNDQGTVLLEGLGELSSEQTYQFWLLPGEGDPVPLNTFPAQTADATTDEPATDNLTIVNVQLPPTTTDESNFAISIEPDGGSESPTLEQIILSSGA